MKAHGRFVVCPDSFKGTYSAVEVAGAIGAGIEDAGGVADLCPVADGGEGTAETVRAAIGGEVRTAAAHDPLGQPIEASFVLVEGGTTAVIDTAAASGLPLVAPAERDAEAASTYGTGELIAAAIETGARRVLLAAGGSATTDGGLGAIEALRDRGVFDADRLRHQSGGTGPGRASGRRERGVSSPDPPPRSGDTAHATPTHGRWGCVGGVALVVLCDVTTTFEDAARVFGPQKGADPATVARLTERLRRIAGELPRNPRGMPMGGAAGGLSGGLWAVFGAELRPGAGYVLDLLGFERRLAAADVAISGEGRIDGQSLEGKVVGQIAAACAAAGRPLDIVVGEDALDRNLIGDLPIRSIREAGTLAALREGGRQIAAPRR